MRRHKLSAKNLLTIFVNFTLASGSESHNITGYFC
jgi:hypothetical protein